MPRCRRTWGPIIRRARRWPISAIIASVFCYRNADGFPEQHDTIVDLVFVQSGEGVLQLGGTMIDKKATGSPGEYAGSRLDGGSRHPLAAGDVIHIPAAVPHAFLVTKGQHLTYVLVKFPE